MKEVFSSSMGHVIETPGTKPITQNDFYKVCPSVGPMPGPILWGRRRTKKMLLSLSRAGRVGHSTEGVYVNTHFNDRGRRVVRLCQALLCRCTLS